jgi:hypothetical protein
VNRLIALLESIRDRIGVQSSGTSSVEIKTSARGVDVTVKCYAPDPNTPVSVVGDAAMDEYIRVNSSLTERIKSYQP